MVKPTARSRSVSATPEIVSRWDAGGDVKNDLIRTMMKCEGNKDVWKRTVEIQIRRSKSNDLTIVQRIKKVVKYCMNPKRIKTHTRRDKYEKDKVEYWVEEETKGSYKISQMEVWNDKREMEISGDMDLDGEATPGDADDDSDDDDDENDDASLGSSGSSGSSTKGKKRKRSGRSRKKKQTKKDKKQGKAKKARKEKKHRVSSPSSKAGTPNKSEALEEEARSEAIENAGTLMQQLLRVQTKIEACAGKLEAIPGDKAKSIFGCTESCMVLSRDTINGYAAKLSGYHDELAEMKASYAGSKKSICQKSVTKLHEIVVEAECARFAMEETKLKRTLLKKPSSKDVGAEAPEVSEKHACKMAAAMYKELQEPGPIQSLGFIKELNRLHVTGHDNRLPDVFLNFKLQAPVPITYEEIGLKGAHPTLRLRSFIETLSSTQGKIDHLLVGNGPTELGSFWQRYRKLHPKHDIFTDHASHLHACVPMMLHLDEGTSHKKKGIMVLSVQPVCGKGSTQSGASGVNLLGSTFCTRFLYSVLLARTYSTKKKILYALLDHWQEDLNDCYKNGIHIDGVAGLKKIYIVVINCKGDWPALTKAGRLSRHHLRDAPASDNPPGICHLCCAGQKGFAWNEFETDAKWLHAPSPLPWTTASPLAKLPHDRGNAAAFYCIDLFHAAHKGVVGDYVASAIVTLIDYEIVGSGQFPARLDCFFAELQSWCKATGHYLNMVRRWFKGNDTTIIAKYLEVKYKQLLADCDSAIEGVLSAIYGGLVAINIFMRKVYAVPLWVSPADASELASQGLLFMRAFNAAAHSALGAGKPRFKYMPKFHLFAHLIHYLRRSAERRIYSLNIISFSCQLDEDFIGRVAAQSRNVSIRTVHDRTVQRYLLNLALRW
ncbi:unnamed protein product [Symbiodinium sp. CCMP2456]|nr:unnamed protein product [Symbiodinium sp. CCMP2456]